MFLPIRSSPRSSPESHFVFAYFHLCIHLSILPIIYVFIIYLPIYLLIVSIIYLFEDQAHVFSLFNNKYIVKHTK